MRSEDEIEIAADDMAGLQQMLNGIGNMKSTATDRTIVIAANNGITPAYINAQCAAKGITLSHLVLKKKSLEHTFMELTGGDTA
jgi:hypothetical protein